MAGLNENMKGPIVIAVVMIRDQISGKYLFGLRPKIEGADGEGQWACVGGHVEPGETLVKACLREAEEEVNLNLRNIKFLMFKEYFYYNINKHMIVFFYHAGAMDVYNLKNMEPDKCAKWDWFSLSDIPDPCMEPLNKLFPRIKELIALGGC